MLFASEHFKIYLQHWQFTLVTDCAVLQWLFTNQSLSPKTHRWALKMMVYGMVLKWRMGTDHIAPGAQSRLRRRGPREPDVDTTLPGDGVTEVSRKGLERPVLDGVPLQSMAHSQPAEDRAREEAPPESSMLNRSPEEIKLDGICLIWDPRILTTRRRSTSRTSGQRDLFV